jgi:hypothetical protein
VPEDIGEGLDRVHATLDGAAEGYFMPWLMDGFRPVREGSHDELSRWKYGLGVGAVSSTAGSKEGARLVE